MKKYILHLILGLFSLGFFACNSQPSPGSSVEEKPLAEEQASPLTQMPYYISVQKAAQQPEGAFGIQSAAHGYNGTYLMMVGGRIQGFHGTANAQGVFESKYSNDRITILNPTTGDFKHMEVPAEYKDFLSSTNMEYFYDGTYLICVGGYGAYGNYSNPERFKTFPRISAIHFEEAVNAIEQQDAAALKNSIITLEDERFRVTGGGLEKIDDDYFLVFGQNYDTIYIGGITGEYTEQVRKFKMDISNGSISISDYEVYKDPSGKTGTESQYHRRDLNVCSAIRPDGSEGITVLGGVFTKNDGGWVNPILINNASETTVSLYTELSQKLSQYECGVVSFYDSDNKTMFHTLMGGISYYFYENGELKPSTIDNWLPFTSSITTIVQSSAGMQEFPQEESQSLPKLLGSDAAFIPNPDLSFANEAKTIIDLNSLSRDGKVLVGWIFGGIEATSGQSSEFNPTYANKVLYEVWLNWNAAE